MGCCMSTIILLPDDENPSTVRLVSRGKVISPAPHSDKSSCHSPWQQYQQPLSNSHSRRLPTLSKKRRKRNSHQNQPSSGQQLAPNTHQTPAVPPVPSEHQVGAPYPAGPSPHHQPSQVSSAQYATVPRGSQSSHSGSSSSSSVRSSPSPPPAVHPAFQTNFDPDLDPDGPLISSTAIPTRSSATVRWNDVQYPIPHDDDYQHDEHSHRQRSRHRRHSALHRKQRQSSRRRKLHSAERSSDTERPHPRRSSKNQPSQDNIPDENIAHDNQNLPSVTGDTTAHVEPTEPPQNRDEQQAAEDNDNDQNDNNQNDTCRPPPASENRNDDDSDHDGDTRDTSGNPQIPSDQGQQLPHDSQNLSHEQGNTANSAATASREYNVGSSSVSMHASRDDTIPRGTTSSISCNDTDAHSETDLAVETQHSRPRDSEHGLQTVPTTSPGDDASPPEPDNNRVTNNVGASASRRNNRRRTMADNVTPSAVPLTPGGTAERISDRSSQSISSDSGDTAEVFFNFSSNSSDSFSSSSSSSSSSASSSPARRQSRRHRGAVVHSSSAAVPLSRQSRRHSSPDSPSDSSSSSSSPSSSTNSSTSKRSSAANSPNNLPSKQYLDSLPILLSGSARSVLRRAIQYELKMDSIPQEELYKIREMLLAGLARTESGKETISVLLRAQAYHALGRLHADPRYPSVSLEAAADTYDKALNILITARQTFVAPALIACIRHDLALSLISRRESPAKRRQLAERAIACLRDALEIVSFEFRPKLWRRLNTVLSEAYVILAGYLEDPSEAEKALQSAYQHADSICMSCPKRKKPLEWSENIHRMALILLRGLELQQHNIPDSRSRTCYSPHPFFRPEKAIELMKCALSAGSPPERCDKGKFSQTVELWCNMNLTLARAHLCRARLRGLAKGKCDASAASRLIQRNVLNIISCADDMYLWSQAQCLKNDADALTPLSRPTELRPERHAFSHPYDSTQSRNGKASPRMNPHRVHSQLESTGVMFSTLHPESPERGRTMSKIRSSETGTNFLGREPAKDPASKVDHDSVLLPSRDSSIRASDEDGVA